MNNINFKPLTLGIVVPCFNEEDALPKTSSKLVDLIRGLVRDNKISDNSKVYFIDDGSKDDTWRLICDLSNKYSEICGIKLSRNFGHQNALLCGILNVPGDFIISLDADLQDDISVIFEMINLHYCGNEVVYAVRETRKSDGIFKRLSAELFYNILQIMKVDIVYNHADFRLMSRNAIIALSGYKEVNLFLRGIVRLIGFKSAIVKYTRLKRNAGVSKYPFGKMLSFAWQGITSFSIFPLRVITFFGILVSFVSFLLVIWTFAIKYFFKDVIQGWSSIVVSIYFLGGIQLLCIGILGEYVGKIYLESKSRPKFHIDAIIGNDL